MTSRGRAAAEVAGVAVVGLLHVAAAGAVVLAGIRLAAPGSLSVHSAAGALASSVALGLACLRVPLESGDVSGTFAPLTGLAVAWWGIVSAARRRIGCWPGRRAARIAAVGAAFGVACAAAAAVAGVAAPMNPSPAAAAVGGFSWGALAAAWATRPRPGRTRDPAPPAVTAAVAGVLGCLAFALLLALRVAGLAPPAAGGTVLLGIAAAPNAAAAIAALGLGARVEIVLDGAALGHATSETLALWDWAGRGLAPPHVLALVLVPLVAVLAGGSVAGGAGSRTLRGLRNGFVLGAAVVVVAWAGSLHATAGAGADRASLRVGLPPPQVVALALGWGVAGAHLGPRLPWPAARSPRWPRPPRRRPRVRGP